MSITSWVFPLLVIFALVTMVAYFLGRRKNLFLMQRYADAMEAALKPADKQYTWSGGYLGFKAEYKGNWGVVKKIKPTLQLKPRVSLLYYPISLLTMRHDKLFLVMETSGNVDNEAHLIKKGHYRLVPPGIKDVEKFRKKEVKLGDTDFELLYRDSKGERQFFSWAGDLKVDFNRVKHLSYTSSTNVLYALVDPTLDLIAVLLARLPEFAKTIMK